jgi:chromosome segregation protein
VKLKRLELNGFKSFSDKTVISFPKGISGVVGPNGCGKSNIVDAIKWVMGEQSPKQLRGKGMEDVIFAGSNKKSSVGMAEVSLVLDNTNGSVPPEYGDYKEVVITRRLFRDGEGEYAINNKPCRLKDITHLFMDTGVGSKAYSVIEQGRIGAIIDSKPEDRRHWIEEAAGISKFKSKKHETLRKLELTQQNLLRVEDVVAEVKRQMNSLYRQAKKAERFKEVRKLSREVDLVLTAKEFQTLEQDRGVKEQDLREQQERNALLKKELSALEEHLDRMKNEVAVIEKLLKENQERYYQHKNEYQKEEGLIHQYRRELETIDQEGVEINRELEDIQNWLDEKRPLESSLAEEVSSFSQKVAQEEERLRGLEHNLTGAKESLQQAQETAEHTKDQLVGKMSERAQVRNSKAGLLKVQEERQRRLIRQNEEKAQLLERLEFLTGSIKTTEARQSEEKEFLEENREGVSVTASRIREMEGNLKIEDTELRKLEQICQQDEAQIRSLKEIRDNFQSYQTGVRTLLRKATDREDTSTLPVEQVLAQGLESEPGSEAAIEAALGDALQALVIPDQSAAIQGIRLLREKGQGKAAFLPMSDFPIKNGNGSMSWEGSGLTPLISKVTVREELQPWISSLLGSFALVSDLEEGLKAWKETQGRVSVVTVQGDLIDARGVIFGGSTKNPESGILYQKNLIYRLEEKVSLQQAVIDRKKEDIKTLQMKLESHKQQLQEGQEAARVAETRLLEGEKQLIRFQEETKPIRRRLEIISLEEDEYRVLEEDQASEEGRLNLQEQTLDQEIESIRENLSHLEEEVQLLEAQLEEERQSLTLAYSQQSALKEKGGHIGRELQALKEAIKEKQERQTRLIEKKEGGAVAREGLWEKIARSEEAAKNLLETIDRLNGQIQSINGNLEKMGREKEEQDGSFKAIREQVSEAEQTENGLRMELAQLTLKLDHLREQTMEQYNQPLEEIVSNHLQGDEDLESLRQKKKEFKEKLEQIGEVNLTALEEYNAFKERYDFYHTQEEDLKNSMDALKRAIQKINATSRELFLNTFKVIQEKMNEVFPILFQGGSARLSLTDENDPLESGVEIIVHPPGKKVTNMTLLSGGEKAMTALALLFSTYMVKPSPFCLLDEIDAFLDDANVERFKSLVQNIVQDSQIILITHNRRIMEMADTLYGVTMEQPGVSKLVSVNLDTVQ